MSLEATMLVLDNSGYSINGDYQPTRLLAQADTVHVLFNHKTLSNPENDVGLMVMAGKSPEVLVTPTRDEGKLNVAMHGLRQEGEADLVTGIQVAQLALKHRQNKNQRQRVIVFVCSPISTDIASLVKLGKKMKKNNVAIDIVCFGSEEDSLHVPESSEGAESNEAKLQALVEAVNSSDNSHYLRVEPGPYLLSERVLQSTIVRAEAIEGEPTNVDEFGVDASMDPELAMALRMSMEEERARQVAAAAPPALDTVPESTEAKFPVTPPNQTGPSAAIAKDEAATEETPLLDAAEDDDMAEDTEAQLAMALALSRGEDVEMGDNDDDEDDDVARAIALSMEEANATKEDKK